MKLQKKEKKSSSLKTIMTTKKTIHRTHLKSSEISLTINKSWIKL